jgi:xanthosine utilization system XapX-like protein
MKRLIISTIAAGLLAGVAHADIEVRTPKEPVSKEEAVAYVAELDTAVRRVCAKAASPIVGPNFYIYQACLKATRADVEKKDPTGLYASRDSVASTVLAAR